jgi:hypothetical protein
MNFLKRSSQEIKFAKFSSKAAKALIKIKRKYKKK